MSILEGLPTEILFNILDSTNSFNPTQNPYPLNTIAATSQRLRDVVEEYARVMLKKHANLAPQTTRRTPFRKKWRSWLRQTCQDCKRKSKRKAIFWPEMTLCKDCDSKIPKCVRIIPSLGTHHLNISIHTYLTYSRQ